MLLKTQPIPIDEAAERAGLSVSTIREHLRAGTLVRAAADGRRAVTPESFGRFLFDLTQERAARAECRRKKQRARLKLVVSNA